jgi:hypothetical protein
MFSASTTKKSGSPRPLSQSLAVHVRSACHGGGGLLARSRQSRRKPCKPAFRAEPEPCAGTSPADEANLGPSLHTGVVPVGGHDQTPRCVPVRVIRQNLSSENHIPNRNPRGASPRPSDADHGPAKNTPIRTQNAPRPAQNSPGQVRQTVDYSIPTARVNSLSGISSRAHVLASTTLVAPSPLQADLQRIQPAYRRLQPRIAHHPPYTHASLARRPMPPPGRSSAFRESIGRDEQPIPLGKANSTPDACAAGILPNPDCPPPPARNSPHRTPARPAVAVSGRCAASANPASERSPRRPPSQGSPTMRFAPLSALWTTSPTGSHHL